MSRIPFVVHFSDSYRSANPALFEMLKGQENDYWTNDLVYNFMTEIMGIQSLPINEPNLTLGNPAYDRTKDNVRTLHGERKIES
jgi:heptose-I-phosphate ethanolaminephosphotransferase